ncbi:hypothetical protein AMTRI_Chr12g269740 [Amborella trichopoda]
MRLLASSRRTFSLPGMVRSAYPSISPMTPVIGLGPQTCFPSTLTPEDGQESQEGNKGFGLSPSFIGIFSIRRTYCTDNSLSDTPRKSCQDDKSRALPVSISEGAIPVALFTTEDNVRLVTGFATMTSFSIVKRERENRTSMSLCEPPCFIHLL